MRALGFIAIATFGCFQVPSTLGQPCRQDSDCDGGQFCVDDVCRDAGVDTTTTMPPETTSTSSMSSTGPTVTGTTSVDTEGSSTTEAECVVENVIYVDIDASGAEDGSSWNRAFVDLHAALEIADSGDQIWIAEGEYRTGSRGEIDRSFAVPNGVSVYGGFVGTECALEERSIETGDNPTTLTGDILDNDGTEWPPAAELTEDNARNVIELAHNTQLDRIIVRGGFARDNSENGGGIVIDGGGSVAISNCMVRRNSATGNGGGIYATVAEVEIFATIFEQNSATVGGAVYVSDGSMSLALVSANLNTSSGDGGGALAVRDNAEVVSLLSSYADNEAFGNGTGGAISISGMSGFLGDGGVIQNNRARLGGGVDVRSSLGTFTNTYLVGNHGGIDGGAALSVRLGGTAHLESSLVTGNDSIGPMTTGALRCQEATILLLNDTVVNNDTDAGAAGLDLEACTSVVTNSIMWDNMRGAVPDDIDPGVNPPLVTYSNIETDVPATEGNISVDPLFVDADAGNFELMAASACIDRANGPEAPTLDILGRPRVDIPKTPNDGLGEPWADMGAYEFTP